ncbi:hypothetical protein MH117_22220 [Paenibacillus sp. ACRRX]|uniref:hypothetical protein n=1 Tax=Paenibacillus sp. ACRRX TaxID=2918206 RepID=UPI001EF3EC86|nr:hypothetical protein [Paenibacillus sp. ACRRX]MCG7410134.1 hypothetical protein [Paenibacillus sp. ACRRX]
MVEKPPVLLELKPGVQVVEAEEDSLFKLSGIQGRTLINLLGNSGRFEGLQDWVPYYSSLVSVEPLYNNMGRKSIQFLSSRNDDAMGVYADISAIVLPGKYYIALANVRNGNSLHGVGVRAASGEYVAESELNKSTDFQLKHVVFRTSSKENAKTFIYAYAPHSLKDEYGFVNSFRLFELSEINYNAVRHLELEQVESVYPYVDGITNVINPYVFVKAKNLCPSFYDWVPKREGIFRIESPFVLKNVAPSKDMWHGMPKIPCVAGQAYTFTCEHDGLIQLAFQDEKDKIIHSSGYTAEQSQTLIAPQHAKYVIVYISNDKSGNFTYKNPMLTFGTVAASFQPPQFNMWAAECELASHPMDGSHADILYVNNEFKPCVLEKWKKIRLDDKFTYSFYNSYPGGKCVRVNYLLTDADITTLPFITKHNGTLLRSGAPSGSVDCYSIRDWGEKAPFLGLGISSKDSGWGDKYTPSDSDINAFFLGWKMYEGSSGNPNTLYDGTGTKAWVPLDGIHGNTGSFYLESTPTQPVSKFSYTRFSSWTPYQMQYLKILATIEAVQNYETGSVLSSGANLIEVGSGIKLREQITPMKGEWNQYYVHSRGLGNKTDDLIENIVAIYINQIQDYSWNLYASDVNIDYGIVNASCAQHHFDSSAMYQVTYLSLSPALQVPIYGSLSANIRGSISDVHDWMSGAERRINVLENQTSTKGISQWIKATLLSGWVNFGEGYSDAAYCTDDNGIVYLRGFVKGGLIGSEIFILPKGYTPANRLNYFPASSNGTMQNLSRVEISTDGKVTFVQGYNGYLGLDGISFLAKQ